MDSAITSRKVIQFIVPTFEQTTSSTQPCVRRCLWELLKATLDKIDYPLICQFEQQHKSYHLRIAVTDLLTMKFKFDLKLQKEIDRFLDTYFDIEALGTSAHQISDRAIVTRNRAISTTSFLFKWSRVRKILDF